MKRIVRVALASAATLFALLCWVCGTAEADSARPPTHEPVSLVEPVVVQCDGFQDNFVDYFAGTQTTFYNQNGEPVRLVIHASTPRTT
jgi:hypothetical protein